MPHSSTTVPLAAGFMAALALAGCSKGQDAKPGAAASSGAGADSSSAAAPPKPPETELNLLIFSEYIDDKMITDFEKMTGAKVRMTTAETPDEMEGKLTYAGAVDQYDVAVTPFSTIPKLVRQNILKPLDHAKLPNLKNLEPRFSGPTFDDDNKYGVPYQWGTVGLMYNKKKLPNMDPSWAVVFDPAKRVGTFELLDEMRDTLGAALKFKGHSLNSTSPEEIKEAGKVVQDAKKSPKCLGFKGGIGAVQDVKSGAVDIAMAWSGDAIKEVLDDKEGKFAYIVPKDGSNIWVDTMVILRGAPHPELAHKFVNYVIDPEAGATLSKYTKYATPNAAAKSHLPPDELSNPAIYPPKELLDRLEYYRDLGDDIKKYDEVWTSIKSQ